MPPKVKFDRQAVLDAAFAIVRREGVEALNARRIAAALGCSTQPLFRAFSSMEEIRAEMGHMALGCFEGYLRRSPALDPLPYKASGLAYLLFAKEEPRLFRLLFMCDRLSDGSAAGKDEAAEAYVLEALMDKTGFTRRQAEDFHLQMFIFTHGLASMIATNYVAYDQPSLSRLLTQQYEALMARAADGARRQAAESTDVYGKEK